MAATCFTCNSSPCCCSTCQPANVIYRGECTDPGTLTNLKFLAGYDYKYCPGRLVNTSGVLNAIQNASGNWTIAFSDTPKLNPIATTAAANVAFGNLLVLGSDSRMHQLEVPATAGLFMQTNATGDLVLSAPPAATVPDPLVINDLNVANTATINDLVTNGTVTLNNVPSGTVVNLLGLDVSNEIVTQTLAAGIAGTMFYENPSSPGVSAPNKTKVGGQFLVIGNRLFDSGANLISVTTSESITVNVAGKYVIGWVGQVRYTANGKAGISLVINGVVVNIGNGRTDGEILNALAQTYSNLSGLEVRSLAIGDVLQLQLAATAAVNTYEVRMIALKFAD